MTVLDSTQPPFSVEAYYTPTLPEDGDHLTAIVAVEAAHSSTTSTAQQRVLLFIIDKSGSMQGTSIDAVRQAVLRGIDLCDEEMIVGVVAFDDSASVLVRPQKADTRSKQDAGRLLQMLHASGGTAFSTGLDVARGLFREYPEAIRRAIFLTDGVNESERPGRFEPVLRNCVGTFECDCWGLGSKWRVGEVQEIARALNGKASLIPSAGEIEATFSAAIQKAASKTVADVRLRLWTPQTSTITLVKQMNPTIEDLTSSGTRSSPQVLELAIGSWAPGETRDYQVDLQVTSGSIGEELLALRPSIVFRQDGQEREIRSSSGRVVVTWTTDEALSSRINPRVAHYTGQDELAQAIQGGLQARERGDDEAATHLLGKAVKLAAASGNDEMTARLRKVVDIEDPATGTVRLKRGVSQTATMDLELESTTTKRAARRSAAPVEAS
ncbi:MAG: VWA domain-containing protein [Chloroflexi bacterium]|nr:VWA domain-containing protein [Chloroflexota bacterium]